MSSRAETAGYLGLLQSGRGTLVKESEGSEQAIRHLSEQVIAIGLLLLDVFFRTFVRLKECIA